MMLSLCIGVDAAVYKIINPDGTVTFSDRPQEGAEELDVGTVQTIDADVPAKSREAPETEFPAYELFEVATPKNDETFRDNGGQVSITLVLQPKLFRDHTISIFMDGKDLGGGGGRTTSVTLSNVDRGSHRVHATVVGKDGEQIVSTAAVTFHLHRASVISP